MLHGEVESWLVLFALRYSCDLKILVFVRRNIVPLSLLVVTGSDLVQSSLSPHQWIRLLHFVEKSGLESPSQHVCSLD
jgi:hypothetical protein